MSHAAGLADLCCNIIPLVSEGLVHQVASQAPMEGRWQGHVLTSQEFTFSCGFPFLLSCVCSLGTFGAKSLHSISLYVGLKNRV